MKYKEVLFNLSFFEKPMIDWGDGGVEFNHVVGKFRMENFPAEELKKMCRYMKDRGEKYILLYCSEVKDDDESDNRVKEDDRADGAMSIEGY